MSKLSELRNEHELVLKKMEALQKSITLLTAGQITEAMPIMQDCINFIKKAILPHFDLEERIILPLLTQHSEKARALATELSEEHAILRAYFDHYCKLVEKNPSGPQLLDICRNMSSKLLSHAHKEDVIIIPMVREHLGITEDDELPEHVPPILYEEES